MPTPTIHHFRKTFTASLWLGVLGAPVVWAIHLQLLYALVIVADRTGSYRSLYVTTAICLLLTIGCGLLSWRDWRIVCHEPTTLESSDEAGRTRFLSVLGMWVSALFTLVIVATAAAVYFFRASWV